MEWRGLRRRTLVKSGAAVGALLLAGGPAALVDGPRRQDEVAGRTSRLFPDDRLAHADLHNHTLFSDGAGDPRRAFASMRLAGLDVAALTDHATMSYGVGDGLCASLDGCQRLAGINEATWRQARALADGANQDDVFVALRGFEWTSPVLGHLNVWFSERWVDPLHAEPEPSDGALEALRRGGHAVANVVAGLHARLLGSPVTPDAMRGFYAWLKAAPGEDGFGGADGIVGFNHPGREPGRFAAFAYDAALRERMISLEIFNRTQDYLFEGTDRGAESPLNQCLNAGWRVGLLGVTDEHGSGWGFAEGQGRAGLWLRTLSRDGVREALQARRFFAAAVSGLRLDATANGVRMGGVLPHGRGPVRLAVDLDRGRSWWGKRLNVQVLRPGTKLPTIAAAFEVRVPRDDEPHLSLTVPMVDAADGAWLVLRVSDPAVPADPRATGEYAQFGRAVAYASPFFLAA